MPPAGLPMDRECNVFGCAVFSVNREDVMGTGGKSDEAIHFRVEYDIVSRLANGGCNIHRSVGSDRDVHEQVQRCRRRGERMDAECRESCSHVIGTVIVAGVAELFIADAVTTRDQGVMYTG